MDLEVFCVYKICIYVWGLAFFLEKVLFIFNRNVNYIGDYRFVIWLLIFIEIDNNWEVL